MYIILFLYPQFDGESWWSLCPPLFTIIHRLWNENDVEALSEHEEHHPRKYQCNANADQGPLPWPRTPFEEIDPKVSSSTLFPRWFHFGWCWCSMWWCLQKWWCWSRSGQLRRCCTFQARYDSERQYSLMSNGSYKNKNVSWGWSISIGLIHTLLDH